MTLGEEVGPMTRGSWIAALLAAALLAATAAQEATAAVREVPASTKAVTLAEEEKKVAFAREQELKLEPIASRTEDALLVAGGELHTDRTRLADTISQRQKWRAASAATQRLISKAQKERAHAALEVSDDEATLRRATQLVEAARRENELEVKHRARSEMDEGRGIAMQRPSGVLLADSKTLNSQSNMVLQHSKSTQAKALAALDLKMAQQLADRASSGMVAAKGYFTEAIGERKKATAAAEKAAADTVDAATVSLTMAHDSGLLHTIEDGEKQGPKALQDIVATDARQVDEAEGKLGAARETLSEGQTRARKLSAEVWQVQKKIDRLREELRVAQSQVLAAAKGHVAATQRLEKASAEVLSSSDAVSGMREEEMAKLKRELHDAQHAQLRASSHYERANEKMDSVNGERTMLQVKVEKLKLKLKQAQVERNKAMRAAHVSHTLVHKLERSLEEDGQSLKQARLKLAQRVGVHSIPPTDGTGASVKGPQETRGDSQPGKRGRDGYSALAASFLPRTHFDADRGNLHDALKADRGGVLSDRDSQDLHLALEHEKKEQRHIHRQQVDAVQSAKDEADSVAQAQEKVQQQLARVDRLEKSLDF